MAKVSEQKRFTVSRDFRDYEALRPLAEGHRPPLTMQYVMKLAVQDLLERHTSKHPTFPLDE